MRFEEILASIVIPEWKLCYIDYSLLKKLIELIIKAYQIRLRRKSLLSASDLHLINQIINQANKYFFRLHND